MIHGSDVWCQGCGWVDLVPDWWAVDRQGQLGEMGRRFRSHGELPMTLSVPLVTTTVDWGNATADPGKIDLVSQTKMPPKLPGYSV